jgi:glycerophosphoryl diester phosphodiesterase
MIAPREDGGFLRLGHRGAPALAAPNSLAGIEAALATGLDGVELDVLSDGLVVAHSRRELSPDAPALDEALGLVAGSADARVLLDLKERGGETALVSALRRHGLVERALVCSLDPATLRAVKRLEPRLGVSRSYPRDRLRVSERGLPEPVLRGALAALRRALPARIAGMLRRAEADAATLHHLVLSEPLVARCHALGAAVFAWTVNDPAALERVVALGVDGVITDDPAVFDQSA